MKNQKTLAFIFAFIISISYVNAIGVGNPIPNPVNVAPGQEATFFFSIDAPSQETACDITFEGTPKFDFGFYTPDKSYQKGQSIVINQGGNAVYGTFKVPQDTQIGQYKQTYCVSCKSIQQGSSSAISGSFCGIPLNINVVTNPTGQIAFPQKPKAQEGISTIALLGAIVVVFLIGLAIYSGLKKKPSKQKK